MATHREGDFPRDPTPASPADVLGTLAAYLIFTGVVRALYAAPVDYGPGYRAGVFALAAVASFGISWVCAARAKDGRPRAPGTARAMGLEFLLFTALALFEVGRRYWLPPSGTSGLLLGGVGLLLGAGLGSDLLGYLGAYHCHRAVADWLAASLGVSGGFVTSAIAVEVAVGAGLFAAGWRAYRAGEGVIGRSLAVGGAGAVLVASWCLSRLGPGYHGVPDAAWIAHLYLVAFAAVVVAAIRLSYHLSSGLLFGLAVFLAYARGLLLWLENVGDITESVFKLTFGVALLGVSLGLERGRAEARWIPDEPSPAGRRRRLAGAFGAAALLLVAALIRGAYNLSGPAQMTARVPIKGDRIPPVAFFQVPAAGVSYPKGIAAGTPLDVWVELAVFRAEEAHLQPGRCVAVPRGAPRPPRLDPTRTIRVPGRMIRARAADGARFEVVTTRTRWFFDLPASLRRAAGDRVLVMRVGRAGLPYPAAIEAAGGDPGEAR